MPIVCFVLACSGYALLRAVPLALALQSAASASGWRRGLLLGTAQALPSVIGFSAAAEEAPLVKEPVAPVEVQSITFPDWFLGDWACVEELFNVDVREEFVATGAVPGTQVGFQAGRAALAADANERRANYGWSLRRERRLWLSSAGSAGGANEVTTAGTPPRVRAAAFALAGPNGTIRSETGSDDGTPGGWIVSSPIGFQWRLRSIQVFGRLDSEKEGGLKFRAAELFEAKTLVGLRTDGPGGLPAVSVSTVYRRVPATDSPTGGRFKVGVADGVDSSRPDLLQAIQTVTVLPAPPPRAGGVRPDIALITYKSRLLLSPVLPVAAS